MSTFYLKYNYYSLFILFVFSSYFLTKIVPISPVHISFIISLVLYFFALVIFKNHRFNKFILLLISIPVIFLSINLLTYPETFKNMFVMIIGVLYVFLSYEFGKNLKTSYLTKVSLVYINISVPLLLFDLYYRINNPNTAILEWMERANLEDKFLFAFKNSAIYFDSNITASLIMINFFFLLYISKKLNRDFYILKFIYFVLIIATLSRAAWVASFIFYIAYLLFYDKEKKFSLMILATSLFVPFIYLALKYNVTDASFITKFELVESVFFHIFNTLSYQEILFGVGIDNGQNYLGRAPHNLLLFMLFENGLILTILYLVFNLTLIYMTKFKAIWLFGPYFLAGMSAGAVAIPYYYAMIGIMILIEKRGR